MMGLPGRERSLTISSAVWIQYTNVTVWYGILGFNVPLDTV